VTLSAVTHEDEMVHGEHNITERGSAIRQIYLNPPDAEAHPDAVRAIVEADLVVIGPGSLYTSVMPNLLVDGVKKALDATSAMRIFVCNVATQHGETDGFTVSDHLRAIHEHVGHNVVDAVVANNNITEALPEAWQSSPVPLKHPDDSVFERVRIVEVDVVADENRYRHDPAKLAGAVMGLYDNRQTGSNGTNGRLADRPAALAPTR
jgi:uncharacterized cofD-like protein